MVDYSLMVLIYVVRYRSLLAQITRYVIVEHLD